MTADDAAEPAFVFTDMAGRVCTLPVKDGRGFSGSVLPEWCAPSHSDLCFEPDDTACFGAAGDYAFGWIAQRRGGAPAWFDSRAMLERTVQRLAAHGIEIRAGFEAEFYLFDTARIVAGLSHSEITLESADMVDQHPRAASPYRIGYPRMQFRPPPFDRHRGLRRRIAQRLSALGVNVVHHDHEAGPGQQEFALAPATPVAACDALSVLKLVTHELADLGGMTASFMPLPLSWCPGSGLHLHLSARQNGKDMLFATTGRTDAGRQAVRRLTAAIPCLAAFATPSPSGLRRLWMMHNAPGPGGGVAGYGSRRGLVRLIAPDTGRDGRVELRFPDASGDPYAMMTAVLGCMFLHPPEPMPAPDHAPVLAMRPLLDQAMRCLEPVLDAAGAHPRYAPAYHGFRQRELDALAMAPSIAEMQLHLGC
ncbi:hypothetical protein [Actibacterium ureilyticum]|uniref:hypothetical protein n=1 Tax=Actibacterium ureilyticum TaxID=1590614 RepID=UPI0015950D05|nr:hypothetical protein [Actibacterium ureilyticum]